MRKSITVVLPSYNDGQGLAKVLPPLVQLCNEQGWKIVVVDDCSNDETYTVLSDFSDIITVIRNDVNLGYGASIKRGILEAKSTWIATMDSDGQHRLDDLVRMAGMACNNIDAVIGTREKNSHFPLSRRPGKWVLAKAADFICGRKIPDINCGLRLLRRDIMLHLFSLTADKFSFSTSTLICLLQLGCNVVYCPVTVDARIGKSAVKQFRDGLYTLMLILRLIILFKPLRVFLPVSLVFMAFGVINQIITFMFFAFKVTPASVVTTIAGLIIFFMSLLADQISGLRRDMLLHDIKMNQLRYHRMPEDQ